MNELIKEFMNRARADYRDKDLPYEEGLVAYSEKFAELIVRECAEVAAEQSAIKPEYRIRRHFGVEE